MLRKRRKKIKKVVQKLRGVRKEIVQYKPEKFDVAWNELLMQLDMAICLLTGENAIDKIYDDLLRSVAGDINDYSYITLKTEDLE